jgi:hypothetical protein
MHILQQQHTQPRKRTLQESPNKNKKSNRDSTQQISSLSFHLLTNHHLNHTHIKDLSRKCGLKKIYLLLHTATNRISTNQAVTSHVVVHSIHQLQWNLFVLVQIQHNNNYHSSNNSLLLLYTQSLYNRRQET